MEQLDPRLAIERFGVGVRCEKTWLVWILIDGVNVRYCDQRSLVVTHDRDLAAIADRVVTPASPGPRGRPGVHRRTELHKTEGR